ncbi:hypothetical protein L915_18105, partial [Phytophthora nicotianae]
AADTADDHREVEESSDDRTQANAELSIYVVVSPPMLPRKTTLNVTTHFAKVTDRSSVDSRMNRNALG